MPAKVTVVCQNYQQDRVIPRHARALAARLGWSLSAGVDPSADVVYLLAYFDGQRIKSANWPKRTAGCFTHLEEEPPGNAKAKLFHRIAKKVQLRTCWADMYAEVLAPYGATVKVSPGLERAHFALALRQAQGAKRIIAGFSGYTYRNHRKGEDLVNGIIASKIGKKIDWRASGRGWPVATKRYSWADLPSFFQSLDILVVPSRVEGIPMPPLEALCCGVSVVIPRNVGMLDELPDLPGIHRYDRGDLASLLVALEEAVATRRQVGPEELPDATEPYSMEQWCDDHASAFAEVFGTDMVDVRTLRQAQGDRQGGLGDNHGEVSPEVSTEPVEVLVDGLVEPSPLPAYTPLPPRAPASKRGIYLVAFGDPARTAASDLMATIVTHMPDVPIALCAAKPIGPESVFVKQDDSDIGARRSKIRMYELAPQEWETVLYMDADMEMTAPVYQFFEWVEDGWDMAATKDPHLVDSMESYARPNNQADLRSIKRAVGTLNALQVAGGVMCFRRNERVKAFFDAWLAEWEIHKQRDQGPLIRALYAHPLKLWLLGNEWNTFTRYMKRSRTAGLLHFPGKARRWRGLVSGPLDGEKAWLAVKRFADKPARIRNRRSQR